MKIIAFYLPQFHEIPENNKWWGDGFTEWKNVKGAKPLFKGHNQPRVPLEDNYYDLTNIQSLIHQSELAKESGIYGFCYYHYWFNGKLLLEKPLELMLRKPEVDIPFCLSWANETWTRTWADKNKSVLIEQTYGDKNTWEDHFNYLFQYFDDPRYIYVDEKPLLVIYRPYNIDKCDEMLKLWNSLAIEHGLKGITFAYQDRAFDHKTHKFGHLFDYGIEYQPQRVKDDEQHTAKSTINRALNVFAEKVPLFRGKSTSMKLNYDRLWERILNSRPIDDKMIPGAFVDWDNTPRYKNRGSMCMGVSPEKFKKYLSLQIDNAKKNYNKDMIFMFAWNEWGEGGYLEPDTKNGKAMLNAIREAVEENE